MWSTVVRSAVRVARPQVVRQVPRFIVNEALGTMDADVSSYNVKDLRLQIKDLKEDKVDLRSARREAMASLEKALASVELSKDKLIQNLEEQKADLKKDLFEANIKAMAVTDTRFLLEVAAKSRYKGVSATAATQELAKLVLEPPDLTSRKLYGDAQDWLKDLKGDSTLDTNDERNVCKLFAELFTNLSLDHHHQNGLPGEDPGMYIGGKHFPVRAAVAILVLEAQKQGAFDLEPIYFCDDTYNPQFKLSGGQISKFTIPS
mmetsp:Transcript_14845/g.48427  ORF Transcript_14845/g.48427 Transcript_14845/m.48427 type:complete len:261 (-) Transcript_14845:294-1076(-)